MTDKSSTTRELARHIPCPDVFENRWDRTETYDLCPGMIFSFREYTRDSYNPLFQRYPDVHSFCSDCATTVLPYSHDSMRSHSWTLSMPQDLSCLVFLSSCFPEDASYHRLEVSRCNTKRVPGARVCVFSRMLEEWLNYESLRTMVESLFNVMVQSKTRCERFNVFLEEYFVKIGDSRHEYTRFGNAVSFQSSGYTSSSSGRFAQ